MRRSVIIHVRVSCSSPMTVTQQSQCQTFCARGRHNMREQFRPARVGLSPIHRCKCNQGTALHATSILFEALLSFSMNLGFTSKPKTC